MGFMGQKKFGDGRKYFCFQVRFRGLGTLGATPTANAPENKNISCLLIGCGTAGLLLLTSFTVMRLATTGYADEISSQNILQDGNA